MTATNGQIPKPTPTLAVLREQRRLVRAQMLLARDKALLESLSMYDDYSFGGSDLWDRIRPQSQDEAGERWIPLSLQSDRRHGSNWPLWRNQPELDRLRQESRVRAEINSFAKGLLKNLTNNVIGKGYDYKVKALNPDGQPAAEGTVTPEGLTLTRSAQSIVNEFLAENHWNASINARHFSDTTALGGTREREIYRTVQIDGDCFLRFHQMEGGKLRVRPLDAAQIRSHTDLPRDGLTYGIRHQMDPYEDVETPLSYDVFWPDPSAKGGDGRDNPSNYQEVDASEILHLKGPDTPSTVKRGLPLFVFDVGSSLDRAAKLQRNASVGAAVRAAVAETWQHNTANASQMQSFSDALRERSETDPARGKPRNVERVFPGMIRRGDSGWEIVQPSADNTSSYLSGVQGDLQQGCAGAGVASFVIGDVSSGNYSNYESASFPPVQNAACEQEYYKAAFARAVWKALEWAVECGRLPREALTQLTLIVEAPAVLHRNELEKAQEDQIGVQAGWKDRQTCAAERGLDWKTVEANNQEHNEAAAQMAQQYGQPTGDNGASAADPTRSAAAKQAAALRGRGVRESFYPDLPDPLYERLQRLRESYGDRMAEEIAGAATRLLEDWDEQKHPRGQPGNAGEFGSGGGASDSAKPAKKPKLTPDEKKAASDAHFEELMRSKKPSDATAFRKARADGVAIPPAWTEVVYHGADKDILAEGRDDKGRKQRAENPQYRQNISDANNARITKDLRPRMGKLRDQLRKDAIGGNEESKVLYLISLTGFRIGGKGDGKAKEQAFGASSLMGDHVKVDGNTTTFDFPGKKGVRQQHVVNDPVVADMCRNAEPGKPVFATRDTKVRDAWQSKYGGEKVHDIRHVVASEIAERELAKRVPPPPKSDKQRTALIKEVATIAAHTLGNDPAQTLGTYIDPRLWDKASVAA